MNAIVNIATASQPEEDDVAKEIHNAGGALGRLNGGMNSKGEELTVQNVTRRLNRCVRVCLCVYVCVRVCVFFLVRRL